MIRPAEMQDLPAILSVYGAARQFMQQNGNPTQWAGGYPPDSLLKEDILAGRLYVLEEAGGVHGAFALIFGNDPTYASVENGAWLSDEPYAAIHRVAGDGAVKGVFSQCLAFCKSRCGHLRIDTHADNKVMRHLIEKSDFVCCGIIRVADGSPRVAYEFISR